MTTMLGYAGLVFSDLKPVLFPVVGIIMALFILERAFEIFIHKEK